MSKWIETADCNLIVIQPPAPLDRQVGEIELIGEGGKPWGKVQISLYDLPEGISNADMLFSMEQAKTVLLKDGFYYKRKTAPVFDNLTDDELRKVHEMLQKKIPAKPAVKKPDWHFRVKGSKNKQFHFHLRAPNNKIVMVSETYKSKQACLKSLNAVQNVAFALGGRILDVKDMTL